VPGKYRNTAKITHALQNVLFITVNGVVVGNLLSGTCQKRIHIRKLCKNKKGDIENGIQRSVNYKKLSKTIL
jgi:hypothetical protein